MTDSPAAPRREGLRLQVLIATMGAGGIQSVATSAHPHVEGVEYLVGWQMPEGEVPEALRRPDFRILPHPTQGLSRNRNFLLDHASAPLALISDDDISYTEKGLRTVIEAFGRNPRADILTFRYGTGNGGKKYPAAGFDLSDPPKGYYLSSVEIALRSQAFNESGIRFNENFGLGSDAFISGEETILLHDTLHAGLHGRFVPETICYHPDEPTTGSREQLNPEQEIATAAVTSRLHPFTWPLRMVRHALRSKRFGFIPLIWAWLTGVDRARRMKVWDTAPQCGYPNRLIQDYGKESD